MQLTAAPGKFTKPFAGSAGSAYWRQVPTASQASVQAGAASLEDGFPPVTFTAVAAGGIPPFGQDMNGILRQITQWSQWQQAGNPITYDASFASAVGGYPKGAQLLSVSGHAIYESLIDNNTTNPESVSGTWRITSSVWSATYWTAAGAANTQSVTLTPAPTGLAQLTGIPLTIVSSGTNVSTSAVTLSCNGLAAVPIQTAGGINLGPGALVATYPFSVVYNGSAFVLLSPTSSFLDPSTAGVTIYGAGGSGANLALIGNGQTTPKKYIRATNGRLAITNDAYTREIVTVTDAGDLSTFGGMTAGTSVTATTTMQAGTTIAAGTGITSAQGNITATAGRVRALLGGYNSGDNFACTVIGDFPGSLQNGSGYMRLPNGLLICWGFAAGPSVAGTLSAFVPYAITFNAAFSTILTPANNNNAQTTSWLVSTQGNGFWFSCSVANIGTYYIALGV